jgi:hypothetical protein
MNDSITRALAKLTPQPTSTALRDRVFSVLERELRRRRKPRWERYFERSVAATVLIAIGLTCWRSWPAGAPPAPRFARMPPPESIADVAKAVASVTDEQTGRWVQEQLSAAWTSRPAETSQSATSRGGRLTN